MHLDPTARANGAVDRPGAGFIDMSRSRWPEVKAEHDRVTIMIGGVGVSITTEDSRQLRKKLIAAELEADRHPRRTS